MVRKSLEVLPPDAERPLYRHCYGIRMSTWSAPAGYIERIYFLPPIHLEPELRCHLEATFSDIVRLLDFEIDAAILARAPARPTPKPPAGEA